jgi:hypothetical protein
MPAEIPPIIGNDASLDLVPGTYPGDLVIEGNDNHVSGAGAGVTIIAGSLRVVGDDNHVSDLTVCGRSAVKGQYNTVVGVEFQRGVAGAGNRAAWILGGILVGFLALFVGGMLLLPGLVRSCQDEPATAKGGAPTAKEPEWARETRRTTAPLSDAARGFVTDLAAGRHEGAYGRMSALYRKAVSLERFRAAVKAHPYLAAARDAAVRKVSTTGGQIGQATGFLQTSEGSVDVVFHCSRESEGWRITGITIAGAPALPLTGK